MRLILFFAFLFQIGHVYANEISSVPPSPQSLFVEGTCDLPAPIGFHVEEIGMSWVRLGWTAINVQAQHRVRIFRSSDHALLSTTLTPSGVFSVKINIPPDENCYAKINAICQDGSHSNLEAVSPDFISLILDLIVNGYQSNENAVQCATQVQSCSFPNLPNVTHSFRVIKPPYIRKFGIKYTGGDPQYEVYLFGHNGTEGPIWIRCENGVDPNPNRCGALDHLEIWFNNNGVPQKMGEFDCSFTTNFLNINVEVNVQNFPDCQVQYLSKNNPFTPAPPTDPNTIERDETGAEFRQSAAVAPNPFSDQLDVYLAFPNKTVANVQLVNLGGQIVVNELLQAGQEKFSLPTAHIAAGFYLLRVEADGVKQTFKVVKAE